MTTKDKQLLGGFDKWMIYLVKTFERESVGLKEGDLCGRDGCKGAVLIRSPENCTCYINPPCRYCTEPIAYCDVCDWDERDD